MLIGPRLVKKFRAFYEIRSFIPAFTRAPPHLSLSWASSFQSVLLSHFSRIHWNIFLLSTPRSPKCSLSLRCTHQNPVFASPVSRTCHMPCPSHSSWFDLPNNIGSFNFMPSWFAWTFLMAYFTVIALLYKLTLFVLLQYAFISAWG